MNSDVIWKIQSKNIDKKTKLGAILSHPEQIGLNEILDMHITIFTWW